MKVFCPFFFNDNSAQLVASFFSAASLFKVRVLSVLRELLSEVRVLWGGESGAAEEEGEGKRPGEEVEGGVHPPP